MKKEHLDFFNKALAKVKHSINVRIPIIPYDHDNVKGHKKALGICWADENREPYQITIDEYFIEECYEAEIDGKWWMFSALAGETLMGTICHEIAHIHVWRHGKKHSELTQYLISCVEYGEPHGIEQIPA